MSKAEEYHLKFTISKLRGFPIEPTMETVYDENGEVYHRDLRDFVEDNGVLRTKRIIYELEQAFNSTGTVEREELGATYLEECIAFFSPPPTVEVWDTLNGGWIAYPMADIIQIFKEWVDFLLSIGTDHALLHR